MYPILKAEDEEEKERLGAEVVEAVKKEIEPLLEGAGPFFGGSKTITLAEVRSCRVFTLVASSNRLRPANWAKKWNKIYRL